ncbi:ABC transporter substrate-binding protein [Burkholderia arboris]|uniref:ABC transporter substrate-binding protein n=1 Tax=Burkholderia arboris TaxID=488730 RepID=UPI001CA3E9E7|nr:ABC transporter substrate-binding protein [Burkholderia arboris]MBY8608717.1 ABC transporter substrate-binding protein [Burkholderia arboris]
MKFPLRSTVATMLAAACLTTTAHAAANLNVLCSADLEWCQLMKTRFAKETGIDVSMIRKSAGESFAQIQAQAKNPQVDVWWAGSGDAHLQAAFEKLTQPYQSPLAAQLQPWAQTFAKVADYRSVGIYQGVLGIGYNVTEINSRKLPAPKCWKDLLNPAFKGEIQIANPNSSGTSYVALATLVQLFGEDDAFKYLRTLNANISQYTDTGVAPGEAASRGESTVAIEFMHDLIKQKVAGFPIAVAPACEGTGFEIGGMSIVAGAKHLAEAKRFYDFALRADTETAAVDAKAYQIPANRDAKVPPQAPNVTSIKLVNYDFAKYGSPQVRKHLLQRWTTEIYNHGN